MMQWVSLLSGVLMTVAAAAADIAAKDPVVVVESTAREALKVLDQRRAEFRADSEALYRAIDELILPVFDVQRAGDLVLGVHARSATVEQRKRFAQALYRSLVRQYAAAALDYTADQLVVRPVRGESDPRATRIESEVKLTDGSTVLVSYVLRQTEKGWKVFDVVAEGISYVRNFREQYNEEIKRRGLDDVIASMERGEAPPRPANAA
jgi:phospholipid transport system substrate-binding protein